MQTDDPYEQWRKNCYEVVVPAGFSDRVMKRVYALPNRLPQRELLATWLTWLAYSRPSRVAICVAAGAACLFRILSVVALFIAL
jgi:hypothetical protein